MSNNAPIPSDEDLPILTAKQVSKYFSPNLRDEDVPKRYIMEADEFLKHFNSRSGWLLRPEFCVPRRTLQFYSSPQVQLLPLPVYRNRHTAHYIVPDHFNRLAAITTLRETHFMPIKLIRKLLDILPPDKYGFLDRWPGTIRDLMDAAPLFKQGFKEDDVLKFLALKSLIMQRPRELYRNAIENLAIWEEPDLKAALLQRIGEKSEQLSDWAASDGLRFVQAIGKSIGGFKTKAEAMEKAIGSKKYHEKTMKEFMEDKVDYE